MIFSRNTRCSTRFDGFEWVHEIKKSTYCNTYINHLQICKITFSKQYLLNLAQTVPKNCSFTNIKTKFTLFLRQNIYILNFVRHFILFRYPIIASFVVFVIWARNQSLSQIPTYSKGCKDKKKMKAAP